MDEELFIIDEIIQILQDMLERGEEIPPELEEQISALMNSVADRLEEGRGQITIPPGNPTIPPGNPTIPDGLEEGRGQITTSPGNATIPRGADLLWILAGGDPEAFAQYLETFPDPALNQLARNPEHLGSVIERLQNQVSLPVGETADGIAATGLASSNVYGFQYNPNTKRLFVKFNGKDSRQGGPTYEYEGVPPQVFKMFQSGAVPAKTEGKNKFGSWWKGKQPSIGASFYELIRQAGYPYQKVA